MEWGWIPALLGILGLALQVSFQVGELKGKLEGIERRLGRLENLMNSKMKGGEGSAEDPA